MRPAARRESGEPEPRRASATTLSRRAFSTGSALAQSRSGMAVRRRWHLDLHGIRREGSKESGFRYLQADGTPVTDEKTLARIAKLRIPPAWRDVKIARGD